MYTRIAFYYFALILFASHKYINLSCYSRNYYYYLFIYTEKILRTLSTTKELKNCFTFSSQTFVFVLLVHVWRTTSGSSMNCDRIPRLYIADFPRVFAVRTPATENLLIFLKYTQPYALIEIILNVIYRYKYIFYSFLIILLYDNDRISTDLYIRH